MTFAEAARETTKWTETENGAIALNTTGDARLDFFGSVGSLREADPARIGGLFEEAYAQDPLFATKIVFYGRDIRFGGLGERRTFRILLEYMAKYHPETLSRNLDLIGVFGRYDDLYSLIGTPLEDAMWQTMKKQFEEDLKSLAEGKAVSLLAKWIKTADASSKATRKMGILTANKLGYSVYEFKRKVRALRKHIGVVESLMSTGRWDEIEYPEVPSRAMMIYRKAFMKHDEDRFNEYVNRAVRGEEKINSSTLFPYDIIEKFFDGWGDLRNHVENVDVLEAQWSQLPDYVEKGTNALVMADTSGSMDGRPLATAIGLAIYFAERNMGAYHNMWMSFSAVPKIHLLKGKTLEQKLGSLDVRDWNENTDLRLAFELVLEIAEKNQVAPEDMPKALIVISDMEIDYCGNKQWTFYDKMESKFHEAGYEIPGIIFWDVASRHDVFHADEKRKGVQLVSGQSASVFKQVMANIGVTPVEAMERVINSEQYDCITVEV